MKPEKLKDQEPWSHQSLRLREDAAPTEKLHTHFYRKDLNGRLNRSLVTASLCPDREDYYLREP